MGLSARPHPGWHAIDRLIPRKEKRKSRNVQPFSGRSLSFAVVNGISIAFTDGVEVRAAETGLADAQGQGRAPLRNRERFLNACRCRPVDRPPVWLMRQAGRALPEYRKLKESHSFLELVQTPELAAEVTLQPIRRFDFDAAILFSDILVVAEALGQPYHFREKGGVEMEFPLRSAEDIERLEVSAVTERLHYVAQALPLIKSQLGDRTALLGFAGLPARVLVHAAVLQESQAAPARRAVHPPRSGRPRGECG